MKRVKIHKGCGWKFSDKTIATIHSVVGKSTYLVDLSVPNSDHDYTLQYSSDELREYINEKEVIAITLNGWLDEMITK